MQVSVSHSSPDVSESKAPLSHIAATNESSVPVVNLIISRLNQGKLAVTEWESDITPSKAWVRKDIAIKSQIAMEEAISTMNQTWMKQQNVSNIESITLWGVVSIRLL